MGFIIRIILFLTQLCALSHIASSGGLRHVEDEHRDRELTTEIAENDPHHHADHIAAAGVMEQRIIGGSTARAGRHPYTVAFLDQVGLFCGGALITNDMVLTAAHCGDIKSYFEIFVGSEYLPDRFGSRKGQIVHPKRGWAHARFSWDTMENDVMIYLLDEPITTPGVEVIRVNDDPKTPSSKGDRLVALGWGNTNPDPSYYSLSDSLMKVGVDYIPNEDCKRRTGYVGGQYVDYWSMIKGGMLCSLDRGKDGCQGDSGGPIVKEGLDSRGRTDVLMGLSSWGVACAHSTLPGVYTRVSSQYDWIKSVVCNHSRDQTQRQVFKCPGSGVSINNNGRPSNLNENKPAPTKPIPRPAQKPNNKPNPRPDNRPKGQGQKKKKKKKRKKKKNNNRTPTQRTFRRRQDFTELPPQ
mmetsp:Transcript_12413/g.26411  ORF Transcript_12413/g.26411 Transcript_12413/m.26411 type:complete len:410 (+) Transcript_12413:231-1460(+)